jgi:hypothetical protein
MYKDLMARFEPTVFCSVGGNDDHYHAAREIFKEFFKTRIVIFVHYAP